ncbi:IVNS1ABP [Symbiodinium natans]|uniref:IVNS1ABP protein n=1 Tax=Symbiodinium natans TaxID=878477 RepID=A0A812H1J2_9DINO|nr:IVNS1ABP [Symbiodinium natans]
MHLDTLEAPNSPFLNWPGLVRWLASTRRSGKEGLFSWTCPWLPFALLLLFRYGLRSSCQWGQRSIESQESASKPTLANLTGLAQFHDLPQEILRVSGQVAAGRLASSSRSWAEGLQPHLQRDRVRLSMLEIFYIGGRMLMEVHTAQDHVQRMHVNGEAWQQVSQLPGARWAAAAAVLEQEILVMGGYSDGQDLDVVDCFQPAQSTWRRPPELKLTSPRSLFSAAALDGRIYIVGGTSCGREQDLCERCDGVGWESVLNLPLPRFGCSAVVTGGALYTIGGFSRGLVLRCCERLDPCARAWRALPSPTVARWSAAAVTLHGRIYVCGGFNGGSPLDIVERFSPSEESWEVLPSLTTPRKHLAAVRAGDSVYVLGGFDGNASTAAVERFNSGACGATGTWEKMRPLPIESEWGVAVAV